MSVRIFEVLLSLLGKHYIIVTPFVVIGNTIGNAEVVLYPRAWVKMALFLKF
jgi:hypothetical protein